MSRRWIDLGDNESAHQWSEAFEQRLGRDVAEDRFWADEIKRFQDQPEARLDLALDNLPLPGAFRDAAIALRAMIRAKRRAGESWEEELGRLYELAVLRSFMPDYAESARVPGYNIVAAAPGGALRRLPYAYDGIGYSRLGLLNKTDAKWLIEAWGEPSHHSTLRDEHTGTWQELETAYADRESRRQGEWEATLLNELGAADEHRTAGCATVLAAFAMLAAFIGVAVWGV